MVLNGMALYEQRPLIGMLPHKMKENGYSYGLAECGYDITIAQNVTLHPFRRFKLASAIEEFDMPSNLCAIVHDKSTWARQGLSVFNTVIEPGWKGFLTLELVYHGWKPLRIKKGTGIAQVIFHELTEERNYSGKYQNQEEGPVNAKYDFS